MVGWAQQEVVVAVINKGKRTLAALSCAAMSLPGMEAKAAVPVADPESNVQYGYYREQGDRMQAQVYHSDFILPFADRVELTFSTDFDTYVGATPLYSAPKEIPDAVSAASFNFDAAWHMSSFLTRPDDLSSDNPLATDTSRTEVKELQNKVATEISLREGPNYYEGFDSAGMFAAFIAGGPAGALAFYDAFIATNPSAKSQFLKEEKVVAIERFLNFSVDPLGETQQKMAQQPRESRTMPILGTNLYLGPVTLGFSGGFSNEPDFNSAFGSSHLSWEFNNKLSAISLGYSLTSNDITRLGGGHSAGHHSGFNEELDESSTFNSFTGGFSQVLSKNTLLQLNAGFTAQRGYLSNPYKFVYIRGEVTAEEYYDLVENTAVDDGDWAKYTDLEVVGIDIFREVRPEDRDQWFFATQLNQHIPALDASVHFNYRYYTDSWKIRSHTFELDWYQSLPFGMTVTPHVRYYSQSSAEFFGPYFLAPREDGHYSSDYRLSSYGKVSSGLSVSKQFAKGVRLDAGFEYYIHKGSLKMGGDGVGDYADITSYLLNASLNVNLSSLSSSMGDHKGHDMHAHHGAHPPAGVMAGHMLGKAGDLMVGYQYMYVDKAGDTVRGAHNASDESIVNNACAGKTCSSKAREMIMHMHMFNFMYAPTDWLNLMLMPKIISMEMDMEILPGADLDEAHEGAHLSEGLGDTLMMGLFKLYDNHRHHLHLGVGVSAPTGNIDATLSGLEGTDLQGYGMQLGSGTWDLKPSLTYTGQANSWSWGAQANATKRLQHRNKDGYALGDEIQGSVWGGYSFFPWLSASVRGVYTAQGSIRGEYDGESLLSAPTDFPENYGGEFWDVGIGMSVSPSSGNLAGNSFSVEWLQPVKHDYNGYQLEQDGSLSVRWGYAF